MSARYAVTAGLLAAAALFARAGWAQTPEEIGPVRGFERLHRELNLNPQQEDLWKKAQNLQREEFRTMRAKTEETRAKLRAEIDKPGADLKKFAQLSDQLREQSRAQMDAAHKQVRDAWFSVYDSLDAKQKEQVRLAIRDGMDHPRGHGARRRGGPDRG